MVLISGQVGHQSYLSFGQVNAQKIKGALNMFQQNIKYTARFFASVKQIPFRESNTS